MLAKMQSFQGSDASCLHLYFLPHDAKAGRTGLTNNGCKRVVMPFGDLQTVLSDNLAIAAHLVERGTVLLDGEGKRHRWYWVNDTGLFRGMAVPKAKIFLCWSSAPSGQMVLTATWSNHWFTKTCVCQKTSVRGQWPILRNC